MYGTEPQNTFAWITFDVDNNLTTHACTIFFQNSTRFYLTFHIRSNSAYIKFQNSRSLSNSIQSTYRTNQIKYYDDPVRQEDYDGHIYIYKLTERTVVLLNAIFIIRLCNRLGWGANNTAAAIETETTKLGAVGISSLTKTITFKSGKVRKGL